MSESVDSDWFVWIVKFNDSANDLHSAAFTVVARTHEEAVIYGHSLAAALKYIEQPFVVAVECKQRVHAIAR